MLPDVNVQSNAVPAVGLAAKLPTVTLIIPRNTALVLAVNAAGTVPPYVPEPSATDVTAKLTVSVRSMSVTIILPVAVTVVSVSVNNALSAPAVISGVSFAPVSVMVTVEVVDALSSPPVAPLLSVALMV